MDLAARMQRFWDARAREDPYYFVDNRLDYRHPDTDRFWSEGERDLDLLLGALGLAVAPGDVVLDLGCGLGRLTRPLALRAATVYAVDVSAEMLERARSLHPKLTNVRWVHGDGLGLAGVGDQCVDACISHVVFQHIPDPQVTLGYVREFARVLRPGGWAAFQVSNDQAVHAPSAPEGLVGRLRVLLGLAPRGQTDPAWLGSSVDLETLRTVAESAGLAVERIENPGSQYCLVSLRRGAGAGATGAGAGARP